MNIPIFGIGRTGILEDLEVINKQEKRFSFYEATKPKHDSMRILLQGHKAKA